MGTIEEISVNFGFCVVPLKKLMGFEYTTKLFEKLVILTYEDFKETYPLPETYDVEVLRELLNQNGKNIMFYCIQLLENAIRHKVFSLEDKCPLKFGELIVYASMGEVENLDYFLSDYFNKVKLK